MNIFQKAKFKLFEPKAKVNIWAKQIADSEPSDKIKKTIDQVKLFLNQAKRLATVIDTRREKMVSNAETLKKGKVSSRRKNTLSSEADLYAKLESLQNLVQQPLRSLSDGFVQKIKVVKDEFLALKEALLQYVEFLTSRGFSNNQDLIDFPKNIKAVSELVMKAMHNYSNTRNFISSGKLLNASKRLDDALGGRGV